MADSKGPYNAVQQNDGSRSQPNLTTRDSSSLEEDNRTENLAAGVIIELDAYDAVVVSAFGGIVCSLPIQTEKGKDAIVYVHPLAMLALNCPLVVLQFSILLFLRVDVDINHEIRPDEDDWTLSTGLRKNRVLQMQMALIFLVTLLVFREVFLTVKMLCFLINPFTWQEIARVDTQALIEKGFNVRGEAFRAAYLFPPTFIAIILKFSVAYMVCIDSASIIFECHSAKDAVFNSLVLLFVCDLDVGYWQVVSTLFRFNQFDAFNFQPASQKLREHAEANNCVLKYMPECLKILKKDRHGPFIEQMIASFILVLVYMNEVAVITYALDTNVLPSARSVCAQWRLENNGARQWHTKYIFAPILLVIEQLLHLEPVPDEGRKSKHHVNKVSFEDNCDDEKYASMTFGHTFQQLGRHYRTAGTVGFFMVCVLLGPLLVQYLKKSCKGVQDSLSNPLAKAVENNAEEDDDIQLTENLKTEVLRLRKELKAVKKFIKFTPPQRGNSGLTGQRSGPFGQTFSQ